MKAKQNILLLWPFVIFGLTMPVVETSKAQQPTPATTPRFADQELSGKWRATVAVSLPNDIGDFFDLLMEIQNVAGDSADVKVSGHYRKLGNTIDTPLKKVRVVGGEFDWKHMEIGDELLGVHLTSHNILSSWYKGKYFERMAPVTFTREQ